jgi:hypothetical protein
MRHRYESVFQTGYIFIQAGGGTIRSYLPVAVGVDYFSGSG